MSTVYLGIQKTLQRKVAIKVLDPYLMQDSDTIARFEREARTAAGLCHSNIVQIFDAGSIGDFHFIVMEYLEESLRERMRRDPHGRVHPEIALDIIDEIMKALDYAHFRGVYHRDIKPDNIMFRQDSTPVLMDFGIARVFDSVDGFTRSHMLLGTVEYMSPEQCSSPKDTDSRSDVYSLGVVLYEMLTGKTPYRGDSQIAIAIQHIEQPVPRLPQELSRYQPLIDKMMVKDRDQRISSGPEYNEILYNILTAPQ